MDSALPAMSPDKSDVPPPFRKPSNDATSRKYRRHSPVGGADSSSSGGSPKRERQSERSRSPVYSMVGRTKTYEDCRRTDDERELKKDSNCNRYSRGTDRKMYGNSHDYHRHEESSRYHKYADEEERRYQRSSWSGRESRSGTRFDHTRHDSNSDRPKENLRHVDKHSRDKSENGGHRGKDKERETVVPGHYRHTDEDSDKAVHGSKRTNSSSDYTRTGEQDRHRDRGSREDKRDHCRSPGDHKNNHASSHDELRGRVKGSTLGRDSGVVRLKESYSRGNKEIDIQKEDLVQKRKYSDRESSKNKDKYIREPEEEMRNMSRSLSSYRERDGGNEHNLYKSSNVTENQDCSAKKLKFGRSEGEQSISKSVAVADEELAASSKQVNETATKLTSEVSSSIMNQVEAAHDLNAAKVAAMKAAELVNRNLVGVGLSADQKKKLLWGNKKSTATEEPAKRWDQHLFADRERQEKFNKLMGVKGDVNVEHKPDDDKDGSLLAERQEQLQMDLEKQYTAGLRRRDGRTVGLGL